MKVFSIRDTKAEVYLVPFTAPNALVALRRVQDEIRNPEHPMHMHADDYMVFEIGEFDQDNGLISPAPPVNHGLVSSLLNDGRNE